MVRVGFVRIGSYPQLNKAFRGIFYREFKDISEMAKWYSECRTQVWVADDSGLTKSEKCSFRKKISSLRRKVSEGH